MITTEDLQTLYPNGSLWRKGREFYWCIDRGAETEQEKVAWLFLRDLKMVLKGKEVTGKVRVWFNPILTRENLIKWTYEPIVIQPLKEVVKVVTPTTTEGSKKNVKRKPSRKPSRSAKGNRTANRKD